MRKSLRSQLLLSHLLLVGLLLGVCLIAVAGFFRLGYSINRILEDNEKSVDAALNMKEALERLDSAAAFYLAGQQGSARQQYERYIPVFEAAYRIEAANVTEPGEQAVVDDLGTRFRTYRDGLDKLINATPAESGTQARTEYLNRLQPQFVRVKKDVQDILDLNESAIVQANEQAKSEARLASLVSVGITVVAVVVGLGLAWRNIARLMTPLVSLTRQAEQVGAGHLNQRIEVRRDDEIGLLAQTFNDMAERLRAARQVEEERLHRAERMSDAALADLYDPVVVTDASGRVVHLNRAAEGLFGTARAAQGQAVQGIVRNERMAQAIRQAATEAQTSAEEGDAALVALAGRTYRLRATPMRDDEGMALGAVAVLEDVTYQQEVDRLKTEFIGVASHELRTPVTSLLLGIDLLEEGAVGDLTPAQQEVVVALRGDLRRLERMMRDLLDLTRLEAGATPPRFQVVRPADLVASARQTVQAQADAKNITLKTAVADAVPDVRADRGQVERVLVNLLSNAIRHTPGGGTIILGAERNGECVRFWVRDTGVGIPPQYVGSIFERFVQVPGATRGGAGLGLSLAQTIVQAHGGDIHVESAVGQGSTFGFTIPVVANDRDNGG